MGAGKRVVIVGGVAGGASAAARARRLCEKSEITLIERGPHVSFANCGLPYYLGGEIPERGLLMVQTPSSLKARFRLDVRVLTEAIHIDRGARLLQTRDVSSGRETALSYDALILATGARPLLPPIPGIDRPGLFTLRNIPDMDAIDLWIRERHARRAVVVGGGYIGLEMAEQLRVRGLEVELAEAMPQVMMPLDPELAELLRVELEENGVRVHLSDGVAAFEDAEPGSGVQGCVVRLTSGARLPADVVLLGLGVRPEIGLAKDAGLVLGERGGIRTDDGMRTSDPAIWAVGDAVEVRHGVTQEWSLLPLAGPANRQGRIAADGVFGRDSRYRGAFGTALLRLFRLQVGCTGANSAQLLRAGIPFQAIHVHPSSHAGYFPGAEPISLKLLFHPASERLLGGQAVGRDGVDKRIDVLATALQAGMTVEDLAELELGYAPPFGSAKDPVNHAGMAAGNVLHGDVQIAQWSEVAELQASGAFLLDVRTSEERSKGAIPGSTHIPLPELRDRHAEIPVERQIVTYCHSGQRSYAAARLLCQLGYRVKNLSGAYATWRSSPAASQIADGSPKK